MKKITLILLLTYVIQGCSMLSEEESVMESATRKSTYKNPVCPLEICGETEGYQKTSNSTQSGNFKNPPCYPENGCY